jgi:hypothetical protein
LRPNFALKFFSGAVVREEQLVAWKQKIETRQFELPQPTTAEAPAPPAPVAKPASAKTEEKIHEH